MRNIFSVTLCDILNIYNSFKYYLVSDLFIFIFKSHVLGFGE